MSPLRSRARKLEWDLIATEYDDPARWSHSGAAVLPDGRFVFSASGGHAIVFVDPAGHTRSLSLPTGTGHGLTVDGSTLLIADPGTGDHAGQVLRVDLDTEEITFIPTPTEASGAWRPTSVAVAPGGALWIADGYGDDLVYIVEPDGTVRVIDGTATGRRFDCPHGIVLDDRQGDPRMLVADRNNRRLVWFTLDGSASDEVADPLLTSPSSLARRADDILITDLYGALLRLTSSGEVRAVVPISQTHRDGFWPNTGVEGRAVAPTPAIGQLWSPHGIAVSPDGVVYLTEWCLGGRQLRLAGLE